MLNPDKIRQEKLLQLRANLAQKPIIAGLKGLENMGKIKDSGVRVCFYLTGHIFELRELVRECKAAGQMVFAHIDLIGGVARDNYGMEMLAAEGVDGVLTTRGHLITAAQKAGLLGIQRLFILDSEALRTGLRMLQSSSPDAVEILPALIVPAILRRLPKDLPPIIAGGLVETKEELEGILGPPVRAVSTSTVGLWSYQRG
ncbi:MAG: glycerol-3-phosphate responsive antiterminator [Firmicutes bacterium]|jgi:glycerol uptake operon antiterminator|nr:glycerol-3-phosphate responsive antiterminator [Bacillota bacterium]NLO65784.1 glycerol-3-phosphate responsive antiterminator [Bacillota bacterium]